MVLGHQALLLTEVKKYLPYNVGHKSIKFYFKPPSLSSFLLLGIISEWYGRGGKKPSNMEA